MAEQNSSTSSSPKVLVETLGRICIIMINRPHCRNAVDGESAHLLFDAFKKFDDDGALDVAIVAGTGGQLLCRCRLASVFWRW